MLMTKTTSLAFTVLAAGLILTSSALAQTTPAATPAPEREAKASAALAKSDAEQRKKAAAWVASLKLNDPAREARVQAVIAAHLSAVRDWHNGHPVDAVPAGVNPATGKPLSKLDRQMIADSGFPQPAHAALMAGLRADLTPGQVEAILDKYTVGKVAFTLAGYHAIVPDLTPDEETVILGQLKQAREEAVDYKNMDQISAVFKIHKTKCEAYLNSHGRDWKKLYKAYSDAARAKKAAASDPKPAVKPAGTGNP